MINSETENLINNPSPEPEVKEPEVKEVDADITKPEKKEEDGPGVVKKIMKKVFKGKVPDEDLESAASSEESEEEGDLIPDEFIEAALASGWTEDDITEFAGDYTDEELKEMIPVLSDVKSEPEKAPAKEDTPSTEKPAEEKKEPNKELDAALDRIDKLEKRLTEVSKDSDAHKEEQMLQAINTAFDDAGKEFEVFGKTDELPIFPAGPKKGHVIPTSPEMKARNEVWDNAAVYIQAGFSTKEAMQKALTLYKGEHLSKDVERKYVKNLKRSEKKLSAQRKGKETVKTYKDEDERRAAVVEEQARKAGVTGELTE